MSNRPKRQTKKVDYTELDENVPIYIKPQKKKKDKVALLPELKTKKNKHLDSDENFFADSVLDDDPMFKPVVRKNQNFEQLVTCLNPKNTWYITDKSYKIESLYPNQKIPNMKQKELQTQLNIKGTKKELLIHFFTPSIKMAINTLNTVHSTLGGSKQKYRPLDLYIEFKGRHLLEEEEDGTPTQVCGVIYRKCATTINDSSWSLVHKVNNHTYYYRRFLIEKDDLTYIRDLC